MLSNVTKLGISCRYDRRSDFSQKIRCATWSKDTGILFSKGYATENWLQITDFEDTVCGEGCPVEDVISLYGENFDEECRNLREVRLELRCLTKKFLNNYFRVPA